MAYNETREAALHRLSEKVSVVNGSFVVPITLSQRLLREIAQIATCTPNFVILKKRIVGYGFGASSFGGPRRALSALRPKRAAAVHLAFLQEQYVPQRHGYERVLL
jgi:hypothetical protein